MNENLLTREELAVRLNLSVGLIDKLRKEQNLPYVKIGRSHRYNIEEVNEYFKKLTKEAKK